MTKKYNTTIKTNPKRILELLKSHEGQPVSRDRVFKHAWGCEYIPKYHSNTLWATMSHTRKALEQGKITQPKRGYYQYDKGD